MSKRVGISGINLMKPYIQKRTNPADLAMPSQR
jgi:hypothetical protein